MESVPLWTSKVCASKVFQQDWDTCVGFRVSARAILSAHCREQLFPLPLTGCAPRIASRISWNRRKEKLSSLTEVSVLN